MIPLAGAEEIPAGGGLVEAGYADVAEWKQLFHRHAGFFNCDPERSDYCIITVPAPRAGRRRKSGVGVRSRRVRRFRTGA
jgi:hypothetical protein